MANIGMQDQDMRVRCSELGHSSCNWEARGQNEGEIMSQVEQHGRDAHNESITERMKEKIREALHRRAA